MKRRIEKRKRDRANLPLVIFALQDFLEKRVGEDAKLSSRRYLQERFAALQQHSEGEETEEALQGEGLSALVDALNASSRLHIPSDQPEPQTVMNISSNDEGASSCEKVGIPFTKEDLWQLTRRVPRSQSTPDRVDIAELCFALHQVSCPVEVHQKRRVEGMSTQHKNAETEGGGIDESSALIRYYKGQRFAKLMEEDFAAHVSSQYCDGTVKPPQATDDWMEKEWKSFVASLSSPLPMTLRIHRNEKALEAIARQYLQPATEGSSPIAMVVKPVPLQREESCERCEDKAAFDLFGCSHAAYHSHKEVEYICRTLHSASALSFQEVVSALPAIVLDVSPFHRVLDMCAAPGSKTLHVMDEMLGRTWDTDVCRGVLVASEKDRVKATQTLPARLKRYHAPNVLCTRCDGTQWPRLYTSSVSTAVDAEWEQVRFDRIICDVPCSGDGTLRKEPSLPTTWSAAYVKSLVPTQVALLRRGIDLLEKDGILVYSTCSLNPKEDEEVVCTVLSQLSEGEVELLDVNAILDRKGIHLRSRGALKNPVEEGVNTVPSSYDGSKMLRVWPHRDNTGGFFVAALRRRSFVDLTPPMNIGKKLNQWTKGKLWAPVPSPRSMVSCSNVESEESEERNEWKSILDFYGLEKSTCFAYAHLECRREMSSIRLLQAEKAHSLDCTSVSLVPVFHLNPNGGPSRRIVLLTHGLASMLFATRPYKGPGVEVVSAGVRAFEKYDTKFLPGAECRWRATVEALSFMAPYCSRRRIRLECGSKAQRDAVPLLTALFQNGFVFLAEYWEMIFLRCSKDTKGDVKDSASSLKIVDSLVVPGSRYDSVLQGAVARKTTLKEVSEQISMKENPDEAGSPTSTSSFSADFLSEDILVGGIILEIYAASPSGELETSRPWFLSATLTRAKLELAVDGSLRAFGLMHCCGIHQTISTSEEPGLVNT